MFFVNYLDLQAYSSSLYGDELAIDLFMVSPHYLWFH